MCEGTYVMSMCVCVRDECVRQGSMSLSAVCVCEVRW